MSETICMPMNRVEGDLEVKVVLEGDTVTDAWVIGTMYRGVETMLIGRGALDGLVITPRICGICSTSHLLAAAMAIEDLAGAPVSANGRLVRHIALAAEKLQSDLRHLFLMFAADLVSPVYADHPLFAEAMRRYRPFRGDAVISTILATKILPEIIAILGGQWPHSSFIVPGGVTSHASAADLRQCRMLLAGFRRWYEQTVLGCPIERILAIDSRDHLDAWLGERQEHQTGELGFFLQCGRAFGLDRIGRSHGSYLAGPDCADDGESDLPGGFVRNGETAPFEQQRISEQVKYARYHPGGAGDHPHDQGTHPVEQLESDGKYSWCKAPRYLGHPAETGPLAEALVRKEPLSTDLIVQDGGASALTRELARLLRPARLVTNMERWLTAIDADQPYYHPLTLPDSGAGVGLAQAPRGLLGHWVRIADEHIEHYQVITPTTWNASPRDDADIRGPIEQALVGTRVRSHQDPVELGHVVRSFDLCMVCSVHAISRAGASLGQWRVAP